MNQSECIKILIHPKNISNLGSTNTRFRKQESLFQQAKQYLLDQKDDLDQQNIICFYKQKYQVIYEQDTVDSIFGQDDKPEIELYLFNDILKLLASYQNQSTISTNQQQNSNQNAKNIIKDITALEKQIEILHKERNEFREKCSSLEDNLRKMKLQVIPNAQNDQLKNINLENYKMKYDLEQSVKIITQLKDTKQKQDKKIQENETELNERQKEIYQEKNKSQTLQQDYNNTKRDKDKLEGEVKKLMEELIIFEQKYDKLQAKFEQQNSILQTTSANHDYYKQQTDQKKEQIIQLNSIISEQEKKIKEYSEELKSIKYNLEKIQSNYTNVDKSYQEKSKMLEKADNNLKFVSFFIENNPFKQLNDLFITPIDAMYQKKINPYEFAKSQNTTTNICDATVITVSIQSEQNLLQWLQFKSYNSINELIQISPFKKLKVLKSINKDGEGSKSKCYLLQIQDTEGNEKFCQNQVFALKVIDGYGEIKKQEHALFLTYQIFVAQALANCFQKKISKCSPPYKFKFQLPHLFTIGENIYIGQQLLNKDYKRFQEDLDHSEMKLFNAFSQFTNDFTSGKLIVTNFKGGQLIGNEYTLFEPIIHTPGGIFSPEDQGQIGFDLVLQSLKQKKPQLTGKEYLQNINYDI